MKRVSIIIIATNRYNEYTMNLFRSIEKYFLLDHKIDIHVFNDAKCCYLQTHNHDRIYRYDHKIESYTFPLATLYRYKIILSIAKEYYGDYIFYIDADSLIVSEIGDEILANSLVAVRHPGFYHSGGSWGNIKKSTSYTAPEFRKHYYAGGFQGGPTNLYLAACELMDGRISVDEKYSIMAEWQDETHWNKLLSEQVFLELNPSYMMPEPEHKRVSWGINNFEPKILALEKPKNFRQ